jgi:hypothetical protein
MKNIVTSLESNQIFVLLDMHQDALSSRSGSYDGIPAWLYDKFPAPAHPCKYHRLKFCEKIIIISIADPWPIKKISSWFLW